MEELLASIPQKSLNLSRGQEVAGEVVKVTSQEVVLDLGTKSEGVISKREIPIPQFDSLKIGDKIKAYVVTPESGPSLVVLSLRPVAAKVTRGTRLPQNKILQGKVTEINKGGVVVEVMGVRGFLPNSQVGFEFLNRARENSIGQEIPVIATETDTPGGRVIFSQRGTVTAESLERLQGTKFGQKVKGEIVAILPFGLVVSMGEMAGLVFASDASWEKVEDLSSLFKVGQEVEAQVLNVDENLGRINLSIKQLTEDPFVKLSQKFTPDRAVKGEVTEVSEAGVSFKLEEGVNGFLSSSKMDPSIKYEIGKQITLLVDSVDLRRRKVNLAPLVTSTAGLIYK